MILSSAYLCSKFSILVYHWYITVISHHHRYKYDMATSEPCFVRFFADLTLISRRSARLVLRTRKITIGAAPVVMSLVRRHLVGAGDVLTVLTCDDGQDVNQVGSAPRCRYTKGRAAPPAETSGRDPGPASGCSWAD